MVGLLDVRVVVVEQFLQLVDRLLQLAFALVDHLLNVERNSHAVVRTSYVVDHPCQALLLLRLGVVHACARRVPESANLAERVDRKRAFDVDAKGRAPRVAERKLAVGTKRRRALCVRYDREQALRGELKERRELGFVELGLRSLDAVLARS